MKYSDGFPTEDTPEGGGGGGVGFSSISPHTAQLIVHLGMAY